MDRIVAIIPARLGSSRFPGKPLASLLGRPMIEHVFRRAMLCDHLLAVYVATCDDQIRSVVEGLGGSVLMTSAAHADCLADARFVGRLRAGGDRQHERDAYAEARCKSAPVFHFSLHCGLLPVLRLCCNSRRARILMGPDNKGGRRAATAALENS